MAASKTEQPPRFVVQCAKGKAWKTLVVEEDQAVSERALREIIKIKPRGYFRLIRLDYNPKADYEGQEFDWKLLQLHDPRKGGTSAGKDRATAKRRRRPRESVPIPIRLYGLALVLGAVLAVMLFLLYGPPLSGQPGKP